MLADLVNRSRPLPAGSKLLILGAGFSGGTLHRLFRALGTPVIGTRREKEQPQGDLLFDSTQGLLPSPGAITGITHLISTIPPTAAGDDPVLSTLLPVLQQQPLRWAGYLSTTGVYGDRQGDWARETDPPTPGQERSRRRLVCEQAWQSSGLPVQILRLPGIYGPGRSVIQTLQRGKARLIHKPNQVFCRIHVEDIAGACLHLMHLAGTGQHPPIVNISDDRPAPSADLLRFAASLLNLQPPPEEDFATASLDMSAMAQSFWSENRRVSNALLCNTLGYKLLHPDFQAGLTDCWTQDRIHPDPKASSAPRSATC